MDNIFAVYKSKGSTSHDVIDEIRRATGVKKVGHAGTLDPLARGILVVGVGREATKKLHEIVAKEKEYIAKICLGVESATDDEEGKKKVFEVNKVPTREDIRSVLKKFKGVILQTPPLYSAVKIKGKAAYKRVRAGEQFEMEPREVFVKAILLLRYKWPHLTVRVVTGPGVYIRALARDIGHALGTGGYVMELERTRVGRFLKNNAIMFQNISSLAHEY